MSQQEQAQACIHSPTPKCFLRIYWKLNHRSPQAATQATTPMEKCPGYPTPRDERKRMEVMMGLGP